MKHLIAALGILAAGDAACESYAPPRTDTAIKIEIVSFKKLGDTWPGESAFTLSIRNESKRVHWIGARDDEKEEMFKKTNPKGITYLLAHHHDVRAGLGDAFYRSQGHWEPVTDVIPWPHLPTAWLELKPGKSVSIQVPMSGIKIFDSPIYSFCVPIATDPKGRSHFMVRSKLTGISPTRRSRTSRGSADPVALPPVG